jgi:hypothetical protein
LGKQAFPEILVPNARASWLRFGLASLAQQAQELLDIILGNAQRSGDSGATWGNICG